MINEKSAGCIIIENEKILLVKQTSGNWGFPKGHLEKGESETEAAIRETKEETNLDVTILDENKRYSIEYDTNKGTHKESVYFLAKKTSNNITRQESEITEIKWFNFEEAIETISFENAKELLKKVLTDLKLL